MEVDNCLELSFINGKYIHLNPNNGKYDLKLDWFWYRVIG